MLCSTTAKKYVKSMTVKELKLKTNTPKPSTLVVIFVENIIYTNHIGQCLRALSIHLLSPNFAPFKSVLAENYFILARNKGYTITPATSYEDSHQHWDFNIKNNNQSFKVDVKCVKKINRKDTIAQDKYIWIELSRGSTPGWLYNSLADLIAFETTNDFIIVNRLQLASFVDAKVNKTLIVNDAVDALYKIYQRKRAVGIGYESLTLIDSQAVRTIASECWEKTELMKPLNQTVCSHISSSENEYHRKAIESINYHSQRLRDKEMQKIKQTIQTYQYCPMCAAKLV